MSPMPDPATPSKPGPPELAAAPATLRCVEPAAGAAWPRYRVWAPHARAVTLRVGSESADMTPAERGWWQSAVPCRHGDDYGFVLDGEGPFADPRSPHQPHGVHGLSRWVDQAEFAWTDRGWQAPPLSSALIYELHVGTFSEAGTFEGAIEHLEHLVSLGVTHVELMPVCEFAGRHGWGYDGVDLYAPHHGYGGPDGLKRLVDACHARSLAVVLDVVYNHLGPAGCYVQRFGPYFSSRHKTAWGDAVNLDGPDSDEVRRFFCDNALMWLRDYHIDALRLDAVHAFIDQSAEHFLRQLAAEVRALAAATGRQLALVAESDLNDPQVVRSADAGGHGIDAQWSDDFHHALHSVVTGERGGYYEDFGTLAHLAAALRAPFIYTGGYSAHRRRRHGASPAGIPGGRFVVSLQNHDQVGNRATGDRIGMLTSPEWARIGALLLLTSPYVPLLFQGEEWSAATPFLYFTDHDAELGAQVSAGRRREFAPFGWDPASIPDPQDPATFDRSKLRWDELRHEPHTTMLAWYRSLVALRWEIPSLREGRYADAEVSADEVRSLLVIRRRDVLIACNFSGQPQAVPLDGMTTLRLASTAGVRLDGDDLLLPPEAAAIVT